MRKKSHISLTKGVVHGLSAEQRFGHRLSLYVGSILPDCTPSFLTRRHCIEDTFDVCEKKMLGFLKHYKTKKKRRFDLIKYSDGCGIALHCRLFYISAQCTLSGNFERSLQL